MALIPAFGLKGWVVLSEWNLSESRYQSSAPGYPNIYEQAASVTVSEKVGIKAKSEGFLILT